MPILDADRILAAARRYRERVQPSRATSGASAERKERTDYLARSLTKARAQLLAAEATSKGAAQAPQDTIRQIARERIVGSNDLVDFNFLELAIAVGRAVARLRVGSALGTGVLVGPRLVMTNNHVIESAAAAAGAVAQFDYQENAGLERLTVHQYRLAPGRFFVTDAALDFTIVAVESVSDKGRNIAEYPWIPLIGQTGKAEEGDPVNIIQHPRGGLKQISFRANCVIDIPREEKDFLYYTTDTEPGSSGSPCFNDQWELIALHHSGVPATNAAGQILAHDGSVWRKGVDAEDEVNWIANEGGRISAIVRSLQAAALKDEAADVRNQMLGAKPPNPVELARRNSGEAAPPVSVLKPEDPGPREGEMAAMNESVTFTIPLKITVSVGGGAAAAPALAPVSVVAPTTIPAPAPAPAIPAPQPAEAEGVEAVVIDPNWSKRKGYDPQFLGFEVPLPKLTAEQAANTVVVPEEYQDAKDKYLLNYHHYSVKMNQRRRSAWFSAGMIDGTRFIDFKRGKDQWFLDARIPVKCQMGEELYAGENTDRGHLTRFKDLSWGANKNEAVAATNDSFHFTNCTLQLSNFNQSQGRWQGLEQFLLENHAKPDHRKMVVFTGPVYKAGDPKYRNPKMSYTVQIPLAFWKVCVLKRKDGSTAATAFTLGQEDITELPGFEEKLDIATAQVTIADLEALTKLDFGDLRRHDVLAQTGRTGVLEAFRPDGQKVRVKAIEEFSDIVM